MTRISGWGRFPVVDSFLAHADHRAGVAGAMRLHDGLALRGAGRAYGDAAIGRNATLAMGALDRMSRFDPATGLLTAEAGVLLSDVIDVFLPRGFFPAVVPGTRFVTLGGAIAADVHGKNHHRDGGFGDHVQDLTLATGAGELISASRHHNADLFFATIGGMGLTGAIVEATIRLRPVETGWIRQTTLVAGNLAETMAALDAGDAATYSVAWIDCVAKGAGMGRALIYLGEHARRSELGERELRAPLSRLSRSWLAAPFDLPEFVLNPFSVAAFNSLYFHAGARKAGAPRLVAAGPYFFPLDGVADWNRLYGRRGFVQHQCVLPAETAQAALSEMIARISARGDASFLAVLKKLGPSNGLISFARPGFTLALDFPVSAGRLAVLDALDVIVATAGGRIYLAKDARQARTTFDAGYPGADRFRALRRELDPARRLDSRLSARLSL